VLDVVFQNVTFSYREGFSLRDVSLTVARNGCTAVVGPPGCGSSTLLRLLAGDLRPSGGEIQIGQRRVNELKKGRRPLLFVTSSIDAPGRWSVEHALVAAVRTRTLDRIDRRREHLLAIEQWELGALLTRRLDTLASTESARVQLATIELLRPAVLVADRLLDRVAPAARLILADLFFRMLRVHGTTVLTVPSSLDELAFTDSVAILDGGRIIQTGSAAEVHARPATEGAAIATGACDAIPVTIRGRSVDSPIGAWDVEHAPFQGRGVALVRPAHFAPAMRGEESHLIFGVEEAGFVDGHWLARGMVSGGTLLRVRLPGELDVHKGKLFPLRYDPRQFLLLPRSEDFASARSVQTDLLPSMRDSR
jgi:iron(III) transport system ATP-binding protein